MDSNSSKDGLSAFERLSFAKWVLRGIFIFALISVAVWLYAGTDVLLEICRNGLLPIASFVIGDYFGSRS